MTDTGKSIDLTPDNHGYANIASVFALSIINDTGKTRKTATQDLLSQIVRIVYQLGTDNDGANAQRLLKHIEEA